jgi:hypothetical protein
MKTVSQDQGPIPALEDLVTSLEPGPVNAETIATLAQRAEQVHLPIQSTMGAWDQFSSLIHWIQGRKLLKQLPERVVLLPWFACHVPRDGSALVSLKAADDNDLCVGLKIFGSGFGKGRELKVSVTSDTEPRKKCATYSVAVLLLPKVYDYDGQQSVVLEVIGEAGTRAETIDSCLRCACVPEDLDPFDYALGNYLDLRRDTVKHMLKMNLQWTDNSTVEAGVSLSGVMVPLNLSLSAKASSRAEWEISYEFAPGFFYQPYRMLTWPDYFPPMWACKK